MRAIGGYFAVCGVLALSACSTTSVASSVSVDSSATTAESATLEQPTNEPTTDSPSTVVPTTQTPDTTVVATTESPTTVPPTTVPPTTVAESTSTTEAPSTTVTVPIINPAIEPVGRANGEATKRAQWRLLQLGFWLSEPNGQYDLTTSQAVTAFQKYYGLERDGNLGPKTAEVLSNVEIRPHGRSNSGTVLEVDKNKQVLFLVKDGVTQWVVNISSGSGKAYDYPSKKNPGKREKGDAVTRNGLHKVYRQRADGWWDGDLGKIYRPKYFTGGIAFHGYNKVPPYPASHGCVRMSLPAMDWIWENDLMPIGTPVWVHEGAPEEYDSVVDVDQRVGIKVDDNQDA